MSLVSEALKKAEREAAARDARLQGAPAPFDAPLQPYRSRRGGSRSRPLVVALALLGSAAAIAIALLLLRPTGKEEAPVKGKTAEAPSTASPSSPPPSPSTALPSASEPTTPPLAIPRLPKAALKPSPSAPSVSEPDVSKPASLPPPARKVSPGSGDYLRSVEFADGGRLELGGIVYSETAPFAYLNGRLVGVGEFVLGRRIDRIERDRVILSGEAGEIVLRLKTH